MNIIFFNIFVFCFTVVRGDKESNLTYTIIAPESFRVNSTYVFSITTEKAESVSATFDFKAAIINDRGIKLVAMKEKLNLGTTSLITLKIPAEVNKKEYKLVASGSGPITFNDSHVLTVNKKYMSIFVQTDKAMYKPGQKVLFRAIAMYSDLKPYVGLMNISIYDADENKILQLLNQNTDIGVVSGNLSLSDQTILGDWKIEVVTKLERYQKKFTVAEYVLPKFEVKVNGPSYYLTDIDHGIPQPLHVSISAKYTYGKAVDGTAVVKFRFYSDYEYSDNRYKNRTIAKSIQLLDGKADVFLPFESIKLLSDQDTSKIDTYHYHEVFHSKILVLANVTETVTSKSLNGQTIISSTNVKYKIEILDISPSNYKPGITYRGFIKLSQFDDSPPSSDDIQNGVIELTVNKFMPYNDDPTAPTPSTELSISRNMTIDPSGYQDFEFDIEKGFRSISIMVKFLHPQYRMQSSSKYVEPFLSRDSQGIQLAFLNSKGTIQPGSTETFLVKTTQPITFFYYQMLSKGTLLRSVREEVGEGSLQSTFSVHFSEELSLQLAPELLMLVYYTTDEGEIIADSLSISIVNSFRNKVSLLFDKEERGPSEEVSLKVKAHPDSYVGILAVDQSVRLLKDGNDIQKDMVYGELRNYEKTKSTPSGVFYCWWWPRSRGGSDTYDMLQNSGVFVLTNGFVYRKPEPLVSWRRYKVYDSPMVAASMPGIMQDSMKTESSSSSTQIKPRVRMEFPETWLWTDSILGESGEFEIKTKVPDTITSWVASAFAMNHQIGFGVTQDLAKVTVFKPFFVSPNLPYSIIRGEEFAMQVTLFNYLTHDLVVTVTIPRSNYFKGTTMSNSVDKMSDKKTDFMDLEEIVTVPSNGARSVYFWIVPVELGQIEIEIRAIANLAADAARVTLLVKPEGVHQEYSTSLLLGSGDSEMGDGVDLIVSLPPEDNLVPGSANIQVTLIGDLMGSSMNGLGNLLQMPYGCGEQNMLNFAPDIYIMQYLTASNMLESDIAAKATEFMIIGYQKELTYHRTDGSFSAFGNSDKSGSVWLSAFVAKCFKQAAKYIAVDDQKIGETLNWIISHQADDGSFSEPPEGRVLHTDMQGGSSSGISMTAYILIALLENKDNPTMKNLSLDRAISKAVNFLKSNLKTVSTDAYALSIISYAMLLHQQPAASTDAFKLLQLLATKKDGMMYWTKKSEVSTNTDEDDWSSPYKRFNSVDIEMTSYALLCYATLKDVNGGLPIIRWILKQRNANGGFSSTQDTVMGLEALAKFSELVARPKNGENLRVVLRATPGNGDLVFQDINEQNTLLLQSIEISEKVSNIKVFSTGSGIAVVQLNVAYNVYETQDNSDLKLNVDTIFNNDTETVSVKSCGKWTGAEASGMVIMEIGQLSGYSVENEDEIREQMGSSLKKIENEDAKLILYLDDLDAVERCAEVKSRKTRSVGNVQDAPISVYRYYEPKVASRVMYSDLSASNEAFKNRNGAHTTTPAIIIFTFICVLLSSLISTKIFV